MRAFADTLVAAGMISMFTLAVLFTTGQLPYELHPLFALAGVLGSFALSRSVVAIYRSEPR